MRVRLWKARLSLFAGLCLLALLPSLAAAEYSSNIALPAQPAVTGAHPSGPGTPPTSADWPMYGHDVSRTNFNPAETTINSGNVNQLVQRWQANIGSNGTPSSSAPSVTGGRVYVGSSAASPSPNFFVFDAVSGGPVWSENIGYRSSCFNVGLGSTPAISGTMIVMGADNAQSNPAYYGINAVSGSVVWTNTMSVGVSGFPWASALTYGDNTYIGIASRCDNPSVRGEIRGLNVNTGVQFANQYFVNAGGAGGGIWNSPALDPASGIIAVGTGEDYTCTDCSLTRSMVALDMNTLAILGHHQEPNPNQDLDYGTTPVIFHDSQNRTLVGANHKNGTFYAYDLTNVSAGPIWSRATGTTVGMMPAYDPTFGSGGTLFIVAGSTLYAVDPAAGNTNRWSPVSIPGTHGNLAIANGLIFINGGSSGLQIRSEADGSLLRTLTPANAGPSNSGVAVSNGFIYWVSNSYINAWSLPSTGTTTPTPTSTSAPTSTTAPSNTPIPTSTATSTTVPSATATGTSTVAPSATSNPSASATATQPAATSTAAAATATATTEPSGSPTSTSVASATSTSGAVTPQPTNTAPVPTDTAPPATSTPQPTATSCTIQFTDVPPGSTFYDYVRCLACRGIVSGYPDGSFRPNNPVTRGQLAKMVSNSAGYNETFPTNTFEDVPVGSTFFPYVERLFLHGAVQGYACGGPGEPCVPPANKPYFRPNANVTRGQTSKIVAVARQLPPPSPGQQTFEDVLAGSPFWTWIEALAANGAIQGYACGGPGEPCVPPANKPYFRPNANLTRGESSKIVANAFFPGCSTPTK